MLCVHIWHLVRGVVVVRELPIESQSTPPFMCYVCTFGACMMSRIMYSMRSLGGYIYTIDIHTYIYFYMYKECALGELSWMFGQNC
jgi:hypothetical protein